MEDDDTIRFFGADVYLRKLVDRKTFVERFWTGLKAACIGLSLVRNLPKKQSND